MESARPPVGLTAWRIVAVVAALIALACTALGIQLDLATPAAPGSGTGSASSASIPGLAMTLPGALLMWQLGGHRIAVTLTGFGVLWGLDGVAVGILNIALESGVDTPLSAWAFWYFVRFGAILLLPILLILLLFPDGRLPSGHWRIVAVVSLVLAGVLPFVYIFAPADVLAGDDPLRIAQLARFDPGVATLPVPDAVWEILAVVAFPATALASVLALAVTISRRRNATAERRSQLRWLIWAGIVFVALLLLSQVMPAALGDGLFALGIAAVSAAVVVAVTRYKLYAIDRLLSWTIVYALLLGAVVLVDIAIYLTVGTLIDDRVTMMIALLAVVAIYTPLRDRIFRLASRWVNGSRDDPYAVLSTLASRLESTADAQSQLFELANSIARAFASGFVRVELNRPDGSLLTADAGTPGEETAIELPLQHGGAHIGRIRMQPGRRPAISARDRRLLSDLVRLAAAALLNAELSRELQSIREDLVAAREEERSRLRRELHDGLGPLLAGIRLRLETSRNLVERHPEKSLAALDAAIDESREVVAEIRRLVHDLRPPALDDLGLVRALAQQAERLSGPDLELAVEASELPRLGAAVEVAAYRIASEALTNVTKHAQASRAVVRLRAPAERLVIEIEDDGVGIADEHEPGVGLQSLRTRAAELGGALEVSPARPSAERPGTLVRATLPRRAVSTDRDTPVAASPLREESDAAH